LFLLVPLKIHTCRLCLFHVRQALLRYMQQNRTAEEIRRLIIDVTSNLHITETVEEFAQLWKAVRTELLKCEQSKSVIKKIIEYL